MSNFTAILAVSDTLKTLLEAQIKADPQLSTISVNTSLLSPKAIRESGNSTASSIVSVWLYRVMRNEYTLNNRLNRIMPNQIPGPPIPVNLYYLITPMIDDPETQQMVLGKVL